MAEGFGKMASTRTSKPKSPKLHKDETKIVELQPQTEHKLDVMRRYFGQYAAIIAKAGVNKTVNAGHIYLVDGFAGVGAHLSIKAKENETPGTGVLACIAAQSVQRTYPRSRIHVRLVDSDSETARRLDQRTAKYRVAVAHPEHVDVTVECAEFAERLAPILEETRHHDTKHYCSLWFLDPFDLKLPHSALAPLIEIKHGVEIIINLDVGGVVRCIKAAQSPRTNAASVRADLDCLNDLFGSEAAWQSALEGAGFFHEELEHVAMAYVATFPEFQFQGYYPLRSDGKQYRSLVHLAHSPSAIAAFKRSYNDSREIGDLKGRKLTMTDRINAALTLFEAFKATQTTLDYLTKQPYLQLNRSQAKVIAQHAHDNGLATYDQASEVISWNAERKESRVLPLSLKHNKERQTRDERQTELFES